MVDILNKKFIQMANPIASGTLGAALIVGMGIGKLKNFSEFKPKITEKATYIPNPANKEIYNSLYTAFRTIYKQLKKCIED
ncbi:MAG: hypothetical protein ACFFD2_13160 [Promethearchaeota archaeon]